MKNILGLDLGSSSIGWSVIRENSEEQELVAMGSRVVSLTAAELSSFTQGNGVSINSQRTQKRTQRKGYDRYQLRRTLLRNKLDTLGMLPDDSLSHLPKLQLWGLRAKAVTQRIELNELGRVLLHLNQKRGYKSIKSDFSGDKKITDYVKIVKTRYDELKEKRLTIGELFFRRLTENAFFRCKEQVYPRQAYVEEFDCIMNCQRKFYPDILTDETIRCIRDEIIYYQRPLKSCKYLVSRCEFEKRFYLNAAGKKTEAGPKVAPRTSPLFQVCRLWESINNIVVKDRRNEIVFISAEQRAALFDFLNTHEKLKGSDLLKLLGLSKTYGYRLGEQFKTGIQGNKTRVEIERALGNYPDKKRLLQFNLQEESSSMVNTETGEIIPMISLSFEQEPLYRLWHVLYSIDDREQLQSVLRQKFGIDDDEVLERLSAIDLVKAGFGNKSSKAIRRILPFLQLGMNYAEACVECNDLPEAKKYLNYVRERAGIPKVEVSWAGIAELTQDKLREIVHQERLIELYLENHNFWDIRRWGIAETLGEQPKGLSIQATTITEFAKPVSVDVQRRFIPAHYLMPLPISEINKNPNMVQNPGYDE